jgi:hypothetical protein
MLKLQFLTIELWSSVIRGKKENSKGNASLKNPETYHRSTQGEGVAGGREKWPSFEN